MPNRQQAIIWTNDGTIYRYVFVTQPLLFDDLVQDCSNSIANTLELLQSYALWGLLHMLCHFDPSFSALENLYSFDHYILAKMRKMLYSHPYFSSKLDKMYSFDPPFYPCSISSRRAMLSIPIRNLTEYPTPTPRTYIKPSIRFFISAIYFVLFLHLYGLKTFDFRKILCVYVSEPFYECFQ